MNRRRFLATLGAGTVPLAFHASTAPRRPIEVRYWMSSKAARHEVHEQVKDYIETALSAVFDPVTVSFGGVVPVGTEHGYHVTKSGEWPMRVLAGYGHSDGLDPARDLNLLITDGPLKPEPPGVARHNIASVGGASRLRNVPPRDEIGDYEVYDTAIYAMQAVLHEVGHALGLDHDHGSIRRVEGGTVASPMVGGYAWLQPTTHFTAERSACGEAYPESRDGARYLSLEYSTCAKEELRGYRRALRP